MRQKKVNVEQFDQNYYFYCNKPETVTPDAYELFQFYDAYFFQNQLEACEIKWSKRMTSCAGTCKHSSYNSCTITLSESLLQFRNSNEVKETLLHEMIHAFLFLTNPKACLTEGGHGEEFKSLMNFINSVTGLNITVYHSFIDEVESFKVHVWKCDGPCQKQPPFFGICKRQMNRPPQKSDFWFEAHQKNCGGQFIKIDGPEFDVDGKIDPTKLPVKKTKKVKSEDSNTKSISNNKKQKKHDPKVDNLQSLISKYMITDTDKSNQNSTNQQFSEDNSNFNQSNKKQNAQENSKSQTFQSNIKKPNTSENSNKNVVFGSNIQNFNKNYQNSQMQSLDQYSSSKDQSKGGSSSSVSLDQFVFQKKDKPLDKSQQFNYQENSRSSSSSSFNNNFTNIIQNQQQQIINNQKQFKQNDLLVKEQQNRQIQNSSVFTKQIGQLKQNDNNHKQNQKKQISSTSSLESQESDEFLQQMITKFNSQKIQQNANNNIDKQQESKQLQEDINKQQILEIQQDNSVLEKESILSQVKIQVAFSRDKSFSKELYYIYLINCNYQLIDVSDLLLKIYNLEDKIYSLKFVIQEINGQDLKIENYPNVQLDTLNELYQILFDFGNLKIYFRELKRINLKPQDQISKVFRDAIQKPQQQQLVSLQDK